MHAGVTLSKRSVSFCERRSRCHDHLACRRDVNSTVHTRRAVIDVTDEMVKETRGCHEAARPATIKQLVKLSPQTGVMMQCEAT